MDDACRACEEVAKKSGKVTRPAGPMKHGSTVIAFVEDTDGNEIESIQKGMRSSDDLPTSGERRVP